MFSLVFLWENLIYATDVFGFLEFAIAFYLNSFMPSELHTYLENATLTRSRGFDQAKMTNMPVQIHKNLYLIAILLVSRTSISTNT